MVKNIEASEYVLKDPDKEKFTTNDFEPVVIAESEEIIKIMPVLIILKTIFQEEQEKIIQNGLLDL